MVLDNTVSFAGKLKIKYVFFVISFRLDADCNQFDNSLQFLDKLIVNKVKCSENNTLVIKVFKSLFVQTIDGLNFGHIYDDCMAI